MVVIIVDCAVAFNAVATIPPSSLMAAATNAMAALPSTAAAQSTTMTVKAVVDEQQTLAIDGGQQHCRQRH